MTIGTTRRSLLRGAALAAATTMLGARGRAAAGLAAAGVIVRQPDGTRLRVDPHTGDVRPAFDHDVMESWDHPVASCSDGQDVPIGVEGAARYRQHWTVGDANLLLAGRDPGAQWWYWRTGRQTRVVDMPVGIEPAFASRSCARWFHGAQVHSAHLGSGTLRLLAFDLQSGETVLDRAFDRRLELAATAVSPPDGAVVAHVQGGNTQIDLWIADLRSRGRKRAFSLPIDPAPVAPSAIDLRVMTDGHRSVAVAGVTWSRPDHPEPFVTIVSMSDGEPVVTSVPGVIEEKADPDYSSRRHHHL